MKTGKLGQWHLEYAQFGCADTLQKKKNLHILSSTFCFHACTTKVKRLKCSELKKGCGVFCLFVLPAVSGFVACM